MKKLNTLILILTLSVSCSQEYASDKYAESITSEELSDLIYEFSSDKFEGRNTGEPGQKLAVEFIRDFYKSNNIIKAENTEDYFQKFLVDFSNDFFSFWIDLTLSKILDFEEVNCPIFDNSIEFFLRDSIAVCPEIASILLIPEATEPSDKILNTLNERVFLT